MNTMVRLLTLFWFGCFSWTVSAKTWVSVDISIIGTASADILSRALKQADEMNAEGVLIELDTPGGALESTRIMVKEIMSQKRPVVVWVGPSGARAGSAGAFITLSGHVAAMAEGTNIGAAHPVQASGKDIESEDVRKKVENDTVAFMESIAQARGRDEQMAVSFVVNSLSITAKEALEGKVIDLIADDRDELMKKIHGMEVTVAGGEKVGIDTEGATFSFYEKTLKQRFLEVLSHPNIFYLLFMAGLIGIGFELTHPGSMIPGVLGGIAMILALIASSVLPVSFGAVILIVASVAFMVAEAFLPSFGILGIGGVVGFVVGSLLLVDPGNEQGLQLGWIDILPVASTFLAMLIGLLWLIVKSEKRKDLVGSESMIGQTALVVSGFLDTDEGRVRFEGENWRAKLEGDGEVSEGREVEIVSRKGLLLKVKPRKLKG